MIKYVARRVLSLIPILIGVSIIAFSFIRLLPGDAVSALYGSAAAAGDPQVREQIRAMLGLDRPLHEQYFRWIGGIAQGDFGISLVSGQPVASEIARRGIITLELTVMTMIMSIGIGVPLGVIAAVRQNGWFDSIFRVVSLLGLAVPGFWIAILMILFISVNYPAWPVVGFVPLSQSPVGHFQSLLLPALAQAVIMAAIVFRMTRFSMLEVLRSEYITAGRARGASERVVIFKHALKNASIPVVTVIGLWMGALVGGAVIVETIFAIPGLGKLVVDAIFMRDYAMLQGTVLVLASSVVLINLLVDLIYGLLDPRIRYS